MLNEPLQDLFKASEACFVSWIPHFRSFRSLENSNSEYYKPVCSMEFIPVNVHLNIMCVYSYDNLHLFSSQ